MPAPPHLLRSREGPGDFLPWLATEENLRRLGNALGLDLLPLAREAPVGRFRADLLWAYDGRGGGWGSVCWGRSFSVNDCYFRMG